MMITIALSDAQAAEPSTTRAYEAVEAILAEHCLDCHAAPDPEAKLLMETHADLMKGGESGPVIVAGKSSESLIVKMIEGNFEKDGKKKIMPPGKRKKLEASEIAVIKAWIDAGAPGPVGGRPLARELNVPKIIPKVPPRRSIQAFAYDPSSKLLAVGRYGEVEFISAEHRGVVRKLTGHRGSVNALAFSAGGKQLFVAAGEPSLFGEVRQWNVADGTLLQTLEGHRDALYSLAVSPDGKILATGSYDQKIKLWEVESGKELRTLSGHNGAIFNLAFRQDGKILASASADRTVKLWDVASGTRRETLSQALKELHAVVFSPDGKRLFAGGVDNRIRVWEISETAAETTNPILESRFAHEGAILRIAFSSDGTTCASSADDRTVKIWNSADLKEKVPLETQPDWPTALAFVLENKALAVGRLDGTLQFYETASGKRLPPPKPQLVRAEPRGIQRGVATKVKLTGANLIGLKELKFVHAKLSGRLVQTAEPKPTEAWAVVSASSDLRRGAYEFSVAGEAGESGRIQLHVDDLPQIYLNAGPAGVAPSTALGEASQRRDDSPPHAAGTTFVKPPVSVWGVHETPGDTEQIQIEAKAGQRLVFDVAAQRLGSKADPVLTLFNAAGTALASNNGFDGSNEPLLVRTFDADGLYTLRVSELVLGASAGHFYRLSIGEFPYVVGCYPLSLPADRETEVELIGYNLPAEPRIKVKTGKSGELELPLDPERFRSRRDFKLIVSDLREFTEAEPNNRPEAATKIDVPAAVSGRIWNTSSRVSSSTRTDELSQSDSDADLFRFETKAGQTWMIETAAAQRGTPVDTKIEVLHADGRPVQRLLLQAVRNSTVTFRGIDSNTPDCRVENWEEMELNEYLYLQGEVVKLFRAPQGPDSGFLFYASNGRRRNYFDTSATAHANEEPCYIVEPRPPGTKPAANGLPAFPLYFSNDDDAARKLGPDSRLYFTAPADGAYLIRVTDARGFGGERFVYRLVVREPRPDFNIALSGTQTTIDAGTGRGFTVSVERIDGFDGEVKIEVSQVPRGLLVSTPLVIEAGHTEAKGTITAALDAQQPTETESKSIVVKATAMVNGRTVVKTIDKFGPVKLGGKPKLFVQFEPDAGIGALRTSAATNGPNTIAGPPRILEITVAPGQTVPAWLKIQRNGHDDLVTFTVENLPHGVIVDNIGLNGVLISKEQNERQIFITAAKWVPETARLCYAVANQADRPTSLPVLLRIKKPATQVARSSN
ncbi:MAG: hypothetical protein HY735_04860 [Verrucomicrobia bacterium]|nr:hypothetical protein [Verrucomicrobiota bacterium]